MPRSTLRRLTTNWGLKLAALGLAVLLWVVVSAEQVTSQWIPVRVQAVVHSSTLRLSGPSTPAAVNVRFTGSGRDLWELAFRRPVLTLSVRQASETGLYALEPSMVLVPGRVAVVAEEIRPEFVRLNLVQAPAPAAPVADLAAPGDSGVPLPGDTLAASTSARPDSMDAARVDGPVRSGSDTLARRDPQLVLRAPSVAPHVRTAPRPPLRVRTADSLARVRP